MASSIVVPELGDSVLEATIIKWVKNEGDFVKLGETVVELETEKANFEVASELTGVLTKITRQADEDVEVGDVLGEIEPSVEVPVEKPARVTDAKKEVTQAPEATVPKAQEETPADVKATPVAKNIAEEQGIDLKDVKPTGVGNKVTKDDVTAHIEILNKNDAPPSKPEIEDIPSDLFPSLSQINSSRENRVKMSRRRRTIARRLKEAQATAAILSTFNEVDMGAVMDIRKRRKEEFKQKYGIGLGFSSFFVKAVIGALREFPAVNAEIQEDEIVYKNYYDIGVAIGAEEGLVVPVIRDADTKSFSEIEKEIKEFAVKAEDGTLALDDLMGGTFSITNGGVFGSLMSTPIINPPQVGILGLHKIEERAVVRDGEIVIRPMMYVALSYDHRIVDGREAVQFLVKLKQLIEDPEILLIEG